MIASNTLGHSGGRVALPTQYRSRTIWLSITCTMNIRPLIFSTENAITVAVLSTIYRPPTKLGKSNVFSRVYMSTLEGPMWPLPMMHLTPLYREPLPILPPPPPPKFPCPGTPWPSSTLRWLRLGTPSNLFTWESPAWCIWYASSGQYASYRNAFFKFKNWVLLDESAKINSSFYFHLYCLNRKVLWTKIIMYVTTHRNRRRPPHKSIFTPCPHAMDRHHNPCYSYSPATASGIGLTCLQVWILFLVTMNLTSYG